MCKDCFVPLGFRRKWFLLNGTVELWEELWLHDGTAAQQSRNSLSRTRHEQVSTNSGTETSHGPLRILTLVRLTLMVTLTVGITRWVHSLVHALTSFPPRACTAWERDALPSVSKHEEHTMGFWLSTLMRKRHSEKETNATFNKCALNVCCTDSYFCVLREKMKQWSYALISKTNSNTTGQM